MPFSLWPKIVARTLTRDLFTVVNILVIMYQPKAAEGGLGWGGGKITGGLGTRVPQRGPGAKIWGPRS